MRKLYKKGILPVATVVAALACTCHAQVYSTNTIGHIQAIKIASQLKRGWTEEEVNQFMATNKLYFGMTVDGKTYLGMSVGDNFAWGEFVDLTDNCWLRLNFNGDNWGRDGSSLQAAYFGSNLVDIISIPLGKASKENLIDKQSEKAIAREDRYERWLQPKLASGYFQEKIFVLTNRAPDEAALSLLFDHDRGKVADDGGSIGTGPETNVVRITASTNDMVIWEKVIQEFDQPIPKIMPGKSSANPHPQDSQAPIQQCCPGFFWTSDHFNDLVLLRDKLRAAHFYCFSIVTDLGTSGFDVPLKDFNRARTAAIKIVQDNSLTLDVETDTNGSGYEIWKDGRKVGEKYF